MVVGARPSEKSNCSSPPVPDSRNRIWRAAENLSKNSNFVHPFFTRYKIQFAHTILVGFFSTHV